MYHNITLVGNLGRDPEMRYMPDGRAVTNLSIATNRTYTNAAGEQVKETIWFRVSVFGKQAESCNQYLQKGRTVLVTGRLQAEKETGGPRIWNAQDGTPRASFELIADTVRFLGSGGEHAQGAEQAQHGMKEADEIPF